MTDAIAADPAGLLAERAWLRRLARALVGEVDADDLSQEVVVAALERRPEPREGLRPWLVQVARRLARQRYRRAERRRRWERAAARDEAQPSAADVVERAQLHRTAVDAVLLLDEPYRTTVLLRFFDDVSMSEVARRCGVPLETARTRLRRGLQMLRARLDRSCGGRAAWAVPLLGLVRGPVRTATVALSGFGGGLLMSLQAKGLLGAAVVLAVAFLAWELVPLAPSPAPGPGGSTPVPAVRSESDRVRSAAARSAGPIEEPSIERRPVSPDDVVQIRGRCVAAESLAPVAGCRVDLYVSPIGVSSRGGSGPDASTVSDADGSFHIDWPLTAPRFVRLEFVAEQRGCQRREWEQDRPGEHDCGDVPLDLGAVWNGRVLDEHGLPVAGVSMSLSSERGSDAPTVWARSGPDGVVRADQVVVAGRWTVKVWSEDLLVRPSEIEVFPGQGVVTEDVVVRRAEDLPAITGVVVDQDGEPVHDLSLYDRGELENECVTAADGSFVLRRKKPGNGDSARLRLFGSCRLAEPDREYPWGTEDARVVVLRPVTAQLQVVDVRGALVERFAVRFVASEDLRSERLRSAAVQERLQDGTLTLRELAPGRYRVTVEPEDPGLGCSAPLDWDVEDGASLRVELQPAAALRVRVVLTDGTPVSGSRLQLLQGEDDEPLRADCQAVPLSRTFTGSQPGARDGVLVDDAITGSDGSAVLEGPPARAYFVRALGPGHALEMRAGVEIAPGGSELLLRIGYGATVFGTLGPRAVLDRLRPTAADLAAAAGSHGDVERWAHYREPVLTLTETSAPRRRLPLTDDYGLRLPPDGTFRFEGIPVGDWRLTLRYWLDVAEGGGQMHQLQLAELVGLRDGEVRRCDSDVTPALPGRVRGQVLCDGRPWRNGRARLGSVTFRTDDDGRFLVEAEPGSYWLALLPADDSGAPGSESAWSGAPVEVVPDVTVEHTFVMRRRVLRLRVLEPDGTRSTGRLILLRGGLVRTDPQPDPDGWIVVDPAPPRPVEVLVYPLGFDAAMREATAPRDRQRLVIRLGAVSVPGDRQQADVELRIPAGR